MAREPRILFIDDEPGLCRMVETVLADEGYRVDTFTRPVEALERFEPGTYDVVVTDVKMPGIDGLEILERVRGRDPDVPVIVITAYATVDLSIQALRKGAYDMLTKPFEPEELLYRVRNARQHTALVAENRELRDELEGRAVTVDLVGESPRLRAVLEMARKVAARDLPVLVTGESGTGKELVARAIHRFSPRREARFVALNCGALPESILEGELFGSRKGAYTGADRDRPGLLEEADGGTLFLDEVGNLPMGVQKSLLRFLQEKEFLRLGDRTPTRVDVRIVSATNADLRAAVREGRFREDLFYRLNVITLDLPPLRERTSDIPLLANHFLVQANRRFGTKLRGFTPEAMRALVHHPWPGNVRQLKNVVEAAAAVEDRERVGLDVVRQFLEADEGAPEGVAAAEETYAAALARFEIDYLRRLLRRTEGNVEEAARVSGMNVATVYRKMKRYGIRREDCVERRGG